MNQIRKVFEDIAKDFFPRWNYQGWSVRRKRIFPWTGRWGGCCAKNTKTILIEKILECESVITVGVLIHEICHAVTPGGHNIRFLNRLRKAEMHAERIGRIELARVIELDGKDAEKISKLSAKTVYEAIYNLVNDDPDMSFDECIEAIAKFYGCHSFAILRFKRCEEIFDKAQRELELESIRLSKLRTKHLKRKEE